MNPFAEYRITSPFGWRTSPITGKKEFHTGIDLVKAHQSPVYAFTEGVVIFASMGLTGTGFGGYGNVVALKVNEHLHVYAHLDSALVRVGQFVNKGQMIGKQGTTGQSTGSHLHYEIRKTCQNTPPYGWIADRENNCHEPIKYLANLYKPTEPKDGYPQDTPQWKKDRVNWMFEQGLLENEEWKMKLEEPVPLWAIADILKDFKKGGK